MSENDPLLEELRRIQSDLLSPAPTLAQIREALLALVEHAIEDREMSNESVSSGRRP